MSEEEHKNIELQGHKPGHRRNASDVKEKASVPGHRRNASDAKEKASANKASSGQRGSAGMDVLSESQEKRSVAMRDFLDLDKDNSSAGRNDRLFLPNGAQSHNSPSHSQALISGINPSSSAQCLVEVDDANSLVP